MVKIKFYNVRKRESVEIEESQCYKTIYTRETSNGVQERYAIRAVDDDGTNLTRFINKATFNSSKCKVK